MKSEECIKNVIQELRRRNPYAKDIFLEKSVMEWKLFHEALRSRGLQAEGFMGSWSRKVWENCIKELELVLEE